MPRGGDIVVAGSYALREYMNATENHRPDWTAGDVDVWIPNRVFPSYIENVFSKECNGGTLAGLRTHTRTPPTTQAYPPRAMTQPFVRVDAMPQMTYNEAFRYRVPQRPGETGCVITSVTDFHVDDTGCTPALSVKVSFISTMPDTGIAGEDDQRPGVTTTDILNRFDLDVCRVAMKVSPDDGTRTFIVPPDVAAAISARKGTVMYGDNPRLADRIRKYTDRGFVFDGYQ
jgi:hypothetical protein